MHFSRNDRNEIRNERNDGRKSDNQKFPVFGGRLNWILRLQRPKINK
jgi:hypothetical protein